MKDIYLLNYSVKGIKTLDQLISLSFYKKTISKNPDTQDYNVKGIYGINGSGKSAIVTSVDILRNLLINPEYLNNPIVQGNLEEIINKKTEELFMGAEYLVNFKELFMIFRYEIKLLKDKTGKYTIAYECLTSKKALSKNDFMETVFEVKNGEIISIRESENDMLAEMLRKKTTNLLINTSMCALFYDKIIISEKGTYINDLFKSIFTLLIFGRKLHVYLDQSDDHRDYLMQRSCGYSEELESSNLGKDSLFSHFLEMDGECLNVIAVTRNVVLKSMYEDFQRTVDSLYEFLRIFKSDLQGIEIDKKEYHDAFICSLIMVYDSYRIHAEFESTGIKKLIKLFAYIKEMVQGGIVFIDEFDSNLHDVYLCALLEYLMQYGAGQLCFTTHNVGPMDILKQHKKSIDFLSVDHKIYPWTTNGNYSPSRLYRNGMIEGSPFNVDSIDFIGVFGYSEEDE
ncbi:AAA family ATPase [Blautia sp. XA-2221]|uniref:AAA family ATPase n=1 Tax=Blautia sp. XA-2221 TaxID=2903961 RepID=UPI0023796E6B|nr:AAA family ATPase [Blautia sp. XA-2221]